MTGFLAEVEGQQIPADTMREADLRGSAVRVLTAHRAKGLEWDLVVVAGVQEGTWPDVRRRGSLLEADRLGPRGLTEAAPTASRIAEERRLFYVACTRARSRLVVTAVAGTEGEGDQPSRFLAELGVPVADPRRAPAPAADPRRAGRRAAPGQRRTRRRAPGLREQAASRLARLADGRRRRTAAAGAGGRPRPLVGDAAAQHGGRGRSRRRSSRSRLSGSQLGRHAGLPAAVVPVPAGPGGVGRAARRPASAR